MVTSICWLRSDLRCQDNTALWNASQLGTVAAVYFATPDQWRDHHLAPVRVDFILRSIVELRRDLNLLGIPLIYRQVDCFADIEEEMCRLADELGCRQVFWNREYAVNERQRDAQVTVALQKQGQEVRVFDDFYILPPGAITKKDGSEYRVYTPYSNAWKARIAHTEIELFPQPEKQKMVSLNQGEVPKQISGFENGIDSKCWPAGERNARGKLDHFVGDHLHLYHRERDYPARNITSKLSPYLAVGAISPRQCLHAALTFNKGELDSGSQGATTWIKELIWREFYGHLLAAKPALSKYQPFRPETESIEWRTSEDDFSAWCDGKTGVPLVDAAMRQLNLTGWMHNRLRMVTAMFLTKNLLIDWRKGEQYFMSHLIDGDLASNNGGWQWSASTGTDAAPYFRIFNPFSQAQRFDPKGEFIYNYVPELQNVPAKSLHNPTRLAKDRPSQYPQMIVDLASSRRRAISVFKVALKN